MRSLLPVLEFIASSSGNEAVIPVDGAKKPPRPGFRRGECAREGAQTAWWKFLPEQTMTPS